MASRRELRESPHRNADRDPRVHAPEGGLRPALPARHYLTRDELNGQDELKALQLFPILRATRAQSWLASMPIAAQKPVIAAGAALGRLRGYRARY